jgi:hypothetical protein
LTEGVKRSHSDWCSLKGRRSRCRRKPCLDVNTMASRSMLSPSLSLSLSITSIYDRERKRVTTYTRGYPNKKKRSGAKKRSRGQKSAPGSKKKCSREHLSQALLRSVLFLAINKRWPKPIITPHTYRRSSITTAVTALPPTRPRHHRQRRRPHPRQLLPDNNQRRGATDPPPSSDTPSRHGMPPPRGGGKV